jgi:hypothetical protein
MIRQVHEPKTAFVALSHSVTHKSHTDSCFWYSFSASTSTSIGTGTGVYTRSRVAGPLV